MLMQVTTPNSWCTLFLLALQSQQRGLREGVRYETGLCFISRSVSSSLILVSLWPLMTMRREKSELFLLKQSKSNPVSLESELA